MLNDILAEKESVKTDHYIELDGRYCLIRTVVHKYCEPTESFARHKDFKDATEAREFLAQYIEQAEKDGKEVIKESEYAYAIKS